MTIYEAIQIKARAASTLRFPAPRQNCCTRTSGQDFPRDNLRFYRYHGQIIAIPEGQSADKQAHCGGYAA
jgi:hypothetical protein